MGKIKKYVKVFSFVVLLTAALSSIVYAKNAGAFEHLFGMGSNDSKQYEAPSVYGTVEKGGILIKWNAIDDSRLTGYKVVASKNNATPSYPEDGYLYFITDKSVTQALIDGGAKYNGGDIGDSFIPGEAYYFSITAVYDNNITVKGNAVILKYPEGTGFKPSQIYGSLDGGKIVLNWTKASDNSKFDGYYLVVSKSKEKPSYPEDGCIIKVDDINKTSAVIDKNASYNNGDFEDKLLDGEAYYFSITASYGDVKVPGKSIKITLPSEQKPTPTPPQEKPKPTAAPKPEPTKVQYPVPNVKAVIEGSKIKISWNKIDTQNFVGYKVVASRNNSHPVYPGDGYFFWITDRNTTYAYVEAKTGYNGGDIGGHLAPGVEYYFSVTAIYDNDNWKKIAGNAVKLKVPGTPEPDAPRPAANLTMANLKNGQLILEWSKAEGQGFQYYKVVISESNPHPAYPDDGYVDAISNCDDTSWSSSLDGGLLKPGHTYYISITVVYDDTKVAGNVKQITVPEVTAAP